MKERPILMNAPMVRATLDGSKTQTRRIVKPQPLEEMLRDHAKFKGRTLSEFIGYRQGWQYGQPGDHLWVRENFQPFISDDAVWQGVNWKTGAGYSINYPATDGIHEYIDANDNVTDAVKPSIHMPRWASRILLEITDVRVEKLNSISTSDCYAEGIGIPEFPDLRNPAYSQFIELWEAINGAGSWGVNPWVWVIEFKVVQP